MILKIKKDAVVLTDPHYDHPNTSLLIFHFEPSLSASTASRMKQCAIKHGSIEEKEIYILDNFFQKEEGEKLRDYSKKASFSRDSYGSPDAIKKGEKPARSMNGKERWQFFSSPPDMINELYQLFGTLAQQMNAEISTLPWELADRSAHGSPAIIANFLEEASLESMELGKHRDCNPEKMLSFGIPVLYAPKKEFHESSFINGAQGKPWLVSVMLYATDPQFLPEYALGTVFYKNNGEIALRANCLNMRLVLFEGDIWHSIEQSHIPSTIKTWRVSYVFKLIINPKKKEQELKKNFFEALSSFSSKIEPLSLGPEARI